MFRTTDDYWERIGATEPYWGVLTHDMYRARHMTAQNRQLFFQSGEDHVARVFRTVRRHVKPDFEPKTALDFGCGVGRVVLPLAQQAAQVVGIDVAPSMLREARHNCESKGLDNVEFVQAKPAQAFLPSERRFDFIHSVLVLQHIPVGRGEQIFKRLLDHLEEDGVAAIHFHCWMKPRWPALRALREKVPVADKAWNAVWRLADRTWNAIWRRSRMQMNCYDLNRLLSIIREVQSRSFHTDIVGDETAVGVMLYVRKPLGAARPVR